MPRLIKKAEVKRTPLRLFAFGVLISMASLSGIQWEAASAVGLTTASQSWIPDRLAVDIKTPKANSLKGVLFTSAFLIDRGIMSIISLVLRYQVTRLNGLIQNQ